MPTDAQWYVDPKNMAQIECLENLDRAMHQIETMEHKIKNDAQMLVNSNRVIESLRLQVSELTSNVEALKAQIDNNEQVGDEADEAEGARGNSMVKGIKDRTEYQERKRRKSSLGSTSTTAILLGDGPDPNHGVLGIQHGYFLFDERFLAVRKLCGETRETLKQRWAEDRHSVAMYEGTGPFARVDMDALIKVMKHDCVSEGVIDSWGEFVASQLSNGGKPSSTMIFPCRLLNFIMSPSRANKKWLAQLFDNQIQSCLDLLGSQVPYFTTKIACNIYL